MESLPFQYQKRPYWEFICPICKTERRSFYWPAPRGRHYWQLAAVGLFMTACGWPVLGFKGVFLIFPVWGAFEFIYRARARQSLICPHCAFDPYLYKYDVKLARDKVARHFEDKRKAFEARQTSTTEPPKGSV